MADEADADDGVWDREQGPGLPPHLAALVGALTGPPDLGRNHDKYLAYPDRDAGSGAASA
jgi:hypothetical protein